MNATIIIAASSILLACVAFAFFVLRDGSDEAGGKSGSLSFSGDGTQINMKYEINNKKTTVFVEDGAHSALWMKTDVARYTSEEVYLYRVVEFENGVANSCRINKSRDQENINNLVNSITVSEDQDTPTYTITEADFEGNAVEISVTATVGDVTMPEFDWSTCLDIGDPKDPFREDGDSRKVLETMIGAEERALGATTASNLAQNVYNAPDGSAGGVHCFDGSSVDISPIIHKIPSIIREAIEYVMGGSLPTSADGQACYMQSDCNFAFRGSDDNADWVDNIGGAWLNTENVNGRSVHAGFFNQFNNLRTAAGLDAKVEACSNPTFIGHSLGGAMANVAHTYYGKGEINTYAGASPYKDTDIFISGKRTYHEYDPVPYLANFEDFEHGGGATYKIHWKCTSGKSWSLCPGDWCCKGGQWKVSSEGVTNNPRFGGWDAAMDVAWNAASLKEYCDGGDGCVGTHFHSMSAHYQNWGV